MADLGEIDEIRALEFESIRPMLPSRGRVLEIGAGSGRQALEISGTGLEVDAIDIPSSDYSGMRVFPVKDYDGATLPFADGEFDLVFSSNVLEHVTDLARMQAEIHRVLKPAGECLHIVPTHAWQFWTSASAAPGVLKGLARSRSASAAIAAIRRGGSGLLRRHGERGNVLTELYLFRPGWWRRHFRSHGFEVVAERPIGYFYTAERLFAGRLSWTRRQRLARLLGSATHVFRLRKART